MMKNNDIIGEVLGVLQTNKSLRNWRLLLQFRSLRRDMLRRDNIENLENLPESVEKLAKESFGLGTNTKYLHYSDLSGVLARIGVTMDDDHFRVFLKDCEMEDNDTIYYQNFLLGLQRLLQDQNLNSKTVVSEVLSYHLKKKKISLDELGVFFETHKWFMKNSDIRDFLVDLHFNLDENGMINIQDIEFTSV